jgi:hypothetical protein
MFQHREDVFILLSRFVGGCEDRTHDKQCQETGKGIVNFLVFPFPIRLKHLFFLSRSLSA